MVSLVNVIAKVSLQDLISIAERFGGMTDQEQAAFYVTAIAYLKTLPRERRSKFVHLLSVVTGRNFHELLDLQDIDTRYWGGSESDFRPPSSGPVHFARLTCDRFPHVPISLIT